MTSKNVVDTAVDPIDALLLISPSCVHCASLLEILTKLVKAGDIGKLEIINLSALPERAKALGVRSVPWLRLGQFELQGAQSEQEIRQWLDRARSELGVTYYLEDLLKNGALEKVTELVKTNPDYLNVLLDLVSWSKTGIKVQLGISAVFEEFEGNEILNNAVDKMTALSKHDSAKVRADIAHFLSLSPSADARNILESLVDDKNRDVREIVQDALQQPS